MTFRLNRRSFVTTATAGAAALIAAAGLKQAQAGVDADTLAGLTATRMLELAPDAFTVATEPGERVTTTLIEVHSASSTPEAGRRPPFDVLFSGPASPLLDDGIYRLEHPGFRGTPALEVFLVRVGPQTASPVYQAVFA